MPLFRSMRKPSEYILLCTSTLYRKRKLDETKAEKEIKRKEMETRIVDDFSNFRKSSESLSNIESTAQQTDRQLQELIAGKEKLAQYIANATSKVKDCEENWNLH